MLKAVPPWLISFSSTQLLTAIDRRRSVRSRAQQVLERGRVADGVAAAVVVEVGVHVPARAGPLAYALGPPAHVFVRVRAGVEVLAVGAVQAHVDEGGGGAQHAREARAARHAVGRAPRFEQP